MELIKLSLLAVLVFVVVDCRRLSKLDKLDNVLAETSKLLDQLKREVIAKDEVVCEDSRKNCGKMRERIEGNGHDWATECSKSFILDSCRKSCDKCDDSTSNTPAPSNTEAPTVSQNPTDPSGRTPPAGWTRPSGGWTKPSGGTNPTGNPGGSGGSGGSSGGSETCDNEGAAPSLPSGFEECSESNKGHCECADSCGFKTYVFQSNGETRCFTIYRPPGLDQQLPVLLNSQCYGQDRLSGLLMVNDRNDENKAAKRYGYARIGLSSPDGHWEFGNDGIVNDQTPMPCSESDSKDAAYVNKVFEFINANPAIFKVDKIYTAGFSQNSMFSAYIAFCHSDKVVGIWQGGSGLALTSQTDLNLPAMQAHCTASMFKEHDKDCDVQPDACPGCKYWPIYPCYDARKPMINCIADYKNDYIANSKENPLTSTAENMFDAMVNEGHDARLLRFKESDDSTIPGGHKDPQNTVYWQMGCWGMTEKCTETCETSFIECVRGKSSTGTRKEKTEAFNDCIDENTFKDLAGCDSTCSPTYDMLIESEEPTTKILSHDIFGANNEGSHNKPSSSKCTISQ